MTELSVTMFLRILVMVTIFECCSWNFLRMGKDFLYFISSSLGFNFVYQITCSLSMDECCYVIWFSINKNFITTFSPTSKQFKISSLSFIVIVFGILYKFFNNLSLSLLWFVILILFLWKHSSNQNPSSCQYSMATDSHANSLTHYTIIFCIFCAHSLYD